MPIYLPHTWGNSYSEDLGAFRSLILSVSTAERRQDGPKMPESCDTGSLAINLSTVRSH